MIISKSEVPTHDHCKFWFIEAGFYKKKKINIMTLIKVIKLKNQFRNKQTKNNY